MHSLNQKLKKFDAYYENCGEIVSDVSLNLIDPLQLPVELYHFNVDKIIDYRSLDPENQESSVEQLDVSNYIPGIPTENMPVLDEITKFESPFRTNSDNYLENELFDDGVCHLKIDKEEETMSETESLKKLTLFLLRILNF